MSWLIRSILAVCASLYALSGSTDEPLLWLLSGPNKPQKSENPAGLKFDLHLSKRINGENKTAPLMLVLHGCHQKAKHIARATEFNRMADQFGFHVLYAQQTLINNPGRCFSWFYAEDTFGEKGEAASLHNAVRQLVKNEIADRSRVFVFGVSAGGAMAAALAAHYPETFAGVCVAAGGAAGQVTKLDNAFKYLSNPPLKSPEELGSGIRALHQDVPFPKMIIWQGSKDLIVHPSHALELTKQWTYLRRISLDSVAEISVFEEIAELTVRYYGGPNAATARVILYQDAECGHSLPVNSLKGEMKWGKKGVFATNRGYALAFLAARDFGLIRD